LLYVCIDYPDLYIGTRHRVRNVTYQVYSIATGAIMLIGLTLVDQKSSS
jgi:hypothetical protein